MFNDFSATWSVFRKCFTKRANLFNSIQEVILIGMRLSDLVYVKSGRILMTGSPPRRIARIFLNEWAREGYKILAEGLPPFVVDGEVFIGDPPLKNPGFDAYLILNPPLSRSREERERLYDWLEENRDKLILLYETKYVGGDSITRYQIRNFIDYLLAYRRETLGGAEVIRLYRIEGGRVVESREFIRRKGP